MKETHTTLTRMLARVAIGSQSPVLHRGISANAPEDDGSLTRLMYDRAIVAIRGLEEAR